MEKLLHERLREIADEKEDEPYSSGIIEALCKEFGVCENKSSYAVDLNNFLKAIADEIEKFYIPRPRFEDGEPVQTSDMEEIGGLATCRVYTDGSWAFDPDKYEDERNPKPWDEQQGRQCDFIKRPKSNVLDANGVPCKKGETVWRLADSTKWEIIDIHPTEPRITVRQLDIGKDVSGGWFLASGVTHREPDSLEKLREDMQKSYDISGVMVLGRYLDRLTAIMERDA